MRKNGQTLVEILVSLVLLSLIVALMMSAFSLVAARRGRLTGIEEQGLNYARETIERLRNNVSADSVRAAPLNAGANIADALPAGDFRDNRGGTRTYTVEDFVSGATQCYKRVTVRVTWND